jgi:hypothetical protein
LRSVLIALKQFEQGYILARWIRSFWVDIMERSMNKARTRGDDSFATNILSVNTQVPFSTRLNPIYLLNQLQIMDLGYSDEWSETSPYTITDWSNMFLNASHDADS